MKIYPYQTQEGIIELVEKREYDGLSLLAHELATLRAEDIAKLVKATKERDGLMKAFSHLSSQLVNITFDPVQPLHFAENVANHVDDLREKINHGEAVRLADVLASQGILQDAVKVES